MEIPGEVGAILRVTCLEGKVIIDSCVAILHLIQFTTPTSLIPSTQFYTPDDIRTLLLTLWTTRAIPAHGSP